MNVITVSQINTYIKALLDESQPLRNIYIVGEISNFKHYYSSGHMYFTLKDENSQLRAVMYSGKASLLKFKPDNGMKVICRGYVSVYERNGEYQLYVDDMQPDGLGALNLAFEQLKEKLLKEGLFDQSHKKPLPKYPRKIGVATSNMGAAIEDIKNILARRYPMCEVVIKPTIVQGAKSSADIVKSIQVLDAIDDIDLIIVGRGGGSIEDLWGFNTEEVARAVYECKKPIVSAVGHETDTTICDYVADLRAPTPSAAAELSVPNQSEIISFLNNTDDYLKSFLLNRLEIERNRLDLLSKNNAFSNPSLLCEERWLDLERHNQKFLNSFTSIIDKSNYKISLLAGKLNALSPLGILSRGYCVAKNNNEIIKSVNQIHANDLINITLADGTAKCIVKEVNDE